MFQVSLTHQIKLTLLHLIERKLSQLQTELWTSHKFNRLYYDNTTNFVRVKTKIISCTSFVITIYAYHLKLLQFRFVLSSYLSTKSPYLTDLASGLTLKK